MITNIKELKERLSYWEETFGEECEINVRLSVLGEHSLVREEHFVIAGIEIEGQNSVSIDIEKHEKRQPK